MCMRNRDLTFGVATRCSCNSAVTNFYHCTWSWVSSSRLTSSHFISQMLPIILVLPIGYPRIGLPFKIPYALLVSTIQTTCIVDYWSINRPTDQSVNRPTSQPTDQPTKPNQISTNQTTYQEAESFLRSGIHRILCSVVFAFPESDEPNPCPPPPPPQIIFKIHFSRRIIL
jgi:hypothetical protein